MATTARRATYSVSDTAVMLGVRYDTLKAKVESTGMVTERVRAIKLGPGRWRVPAAALDRELGLVDDEDQTR